MGTAWVDTVQIVEIDDVGIEALERSVRDGPGIFGTAIRSGDFTEIVPIPVVDEAKLRRDDHAFPIRLERLAQKYLVAIRTINLGSIEEGYAKFDCTMQCLD